MYVAFIRPQGTHTKTFADWVLFIFSGLCFVLTLFIPETLAPVILRRKAEKLRKETGDQSYQSLEELERRPLSETLKTALLRPIVMLLTEPIVIFMSFCALFITIPTCYPSHPRTLDLSFVYSLLCGSQYCPYEPRVTHLPLHTRLALLRLPHRVCGNPWFQWWNDWGNVHQYHGMFSFYFPGSY